MNHKFFVEIVGGLGNQMFQYAFYLKIKHFYTNKETKIYTQRFSETLDNNGFEIDRIFKVENNIEVKELSSLIDDSLSLKDRIRRKLIGFKKTFFLETVFKYNPKVFKLHRRNNVYFRGLWQDELYFTDIRNQVLDTFNFRPFDKNSENYKISELIKSTNSISIHIRRGDYISNEKYLNILGNICTENYYNSAINYVLRNLKDVSFFVFSDDIEWVKSKYSFLMNHPTTFINHNKGIDSYMDMQLMSYCKHNIIANSSFSWWGAWLNKNESKIVIAPEKWFKNNKRLENNHIVPESWMKFKS